MRVFLKFLIVLFLITTFDAAQAADTTKVVARTDTGQVASASVTIVNPQAAAGTAASPNPCNCREKDLLPFEKGLVVLPVGLAVLFFLLVYRVLKQAGYKLADALSENDTVTTTVAAPANALNPLETADSTQTTRTVPGNRSASRLVLFLSGITAIIIAVCITTYYLYYYLYCGQAPALDGLTSVMLTLGIGVIPYAVNKATQ